MTKIRLTLVAVSLIFSASSSAAQGNGGGWIPPTIEGIVAQIMGNGGGWIPPKDK